MSTPCELGPKTREIAALAKAQLDDFKRLVRPVDRATLIAGRVFVVSDDDYGLLRLEFNVHCGPVSLNTVPDDLPPLRLFGLPLERHDGPTATIRPDLSWVLS